MKEKLIYLPELKPKKVLEHCKEGLSPDRMERAELLKDEEERERFLIAEDFTIHILKEMFQIKNPVIHGKAGEKPYLYLHNEISFSRSYAGNSLVLAVSDLGKIGADAEEIKRPDKTVMDYFFTGEERAYVNCAEEKDAAFTLLWTRKESYMKCTGEGLKSGFHVLTMVPHGAPEHPQMFYKDHEPVSGYYLRSYRIGNRMISLCTDYENHICLKEQAQTIKEAENELYNYRVF